MVEWIPILAILAWIVWLFVSRRARAGAGRQQTRATYDRLLKLNPRSANAYFQRARLNREQGDLDAALRDYSGAIQANARYTWAYLGRAIVHTLQKRYDEALDDYRTAERLEPELTEIYHSRAWTHVQQGNLAAAAADYATLITLDEASLEKAIRFGAYMGAQNLDQTLRHRLADWHNQRGVVYQQMADWENAAQDHARALEYDPEQEEGQLHLAWVHYRQGNITASIANYSALIARKASPQHYINRATVYLKTRMLPEAQADFSQAITMLQDVLRTPQIAAEVKSTLEEQLRFSYSLRGAAYGYGGDREHALADHEAALRLNLQEAATYSDRGETYFVLGDYILALHDFDQAVRLSPDLDVAQAGKALTHHALGETDEAHRLWQAMLTREPRYADITWVAEQLNWPDAMIAEVRVLLAALPR